MARLAPDGTALWARTPGFGYDTRLTGGTGIAVTGQVPGADPMTICGTTYAPGTFVAVIYAGDGETCNASGSYATTNAYQSPSDSALVLAGNGAVRRIRQSGTTLSDQWTYVLPAGARVYGLRRRGSDYLVFGNFTQTATFGSLAPISPGGTGDGYILRLSSTGVPQSVVQLGIVGAGSVYDLRVDGAEIFMVGGFQGTLPDPEGGTFLSNGDGNFFVTRASLSDTTLTPFWTHSDEGSLSEIAIDGAGLLVVTGRADDLGGGPFTEGGDVYPIAVGAFDADGTHLWSHRSDVGLYGHVFAPDGGLLLWGYYLGAGVPIFDATTPEAFGVEDMWLLKTAPVQP